MARLTLDIPQTDLDELHRLHGAYRTALHLPAVETTPEDLVHWGLAFGLSHLEDTSRQNFKSA